MSKSEFLTWFRAQYGRRPHANRSVADLRTACEITDRAHWHAILALREREDYETRETAALTAWQAARDK